MANPVTKVLNSWSFLLWQLPPALYLSSFGVKKKKKNIYDIGELFYATNV